MSVSHTLSFGEIGGSVPISDSVPITGSVAVDTSIALSANTTNQLLTLAYLTAVVKLVYIKSDVALTIKVDSSGSPEETISIAAGVPYVWCTGNPSTLLLSTDCNTGWFLTCVAAANVYVRIVT